LGEKEGKSVCSLKFLGDNIERKVLYSQECIWHLLYYLLFVATNVAYDKNRCKEMDAFNYGDKQS
jgi:hypothetical protein